MTATVRKRVAGSEGTPPSFTESANWLFMLEGFACPKNSAIAIAIVRSSEGPMISLGDGDRFCGAAQTIWLGAVVASMTFPPAGLPPLAESRPRLHAEAALF